MNLQQWIIRQAEKLRKQYPEENGVFAIVMTPQPVPYDEGFEGDPLADKRPEFVKKDEVGWERLTDFRAK